MPELVTVDGKPAVKVKITTNAVKIHGPNSELAPEGTREEVQVENPVQYSTLNYEQAIQLLGKDTADELFRGVTSTEE